MTTRTVGNRKPLKNIGSLQLAVCEAAEKFKNEWCRNRTAPFAIADARVALFVALDDARVALFAALDALQAARDGKPQPQEAPKP
jgi:hypothetical protein